MTPLSAEVDEAVRLRDAATPGPHRASETCVFFANGAGGFSLHNCPKPYENAAFFAAAPSHVDLIERLNNALKATQDAYVETSAALTLEQDRNEGLHAKVRELEYENARLEGELNNLHRFHELNT